MPHESSTLSIPTKSYTAIQRSTKSKFCKSEICAIDRNQSLSPLQSTIRQRQFYSVNFKTINTLSSTSILTLSPSLNVNFDINKSNDSQFRLSSNNFGFSVLTSLNIRMQSTLNFNKKFAHCF